MFFNWDALTNLKQISTVRGLKNQSRLQDQLFIPIFFFFSVTKSFTVCPKKDFNPVHSPFYIEYVSVEYNDMEGLRSSSLSLL